MNEDIRKKGEKRKCSSIYNSDSSGDARSWGIMENRVQTQEYREKI